MMEFLVFGASGLLGSTVIPMLDKGGYSYACATSRLENARAVAEELDLVQPRRVLHMAGLTGSPNVDWCDSNRLETIRVNTYGTLNLVEMCHQRGIHMTYYGTGCIYNYDDGVHCIGGLPFAEGDSPNFTGSFYARSKAQLEQLIVEYPNVLVLRMRMPITDDLHPRNLIVKLASYAKLINCPNSVSVLSDLMPVSIAMALAAKVGVYNFTNPGAISHKEMMDLYTTYVDPDKKPVFFDASDPEVISLEQRRSQCHLNVTKLLREYPGIPDAHTSLARVLQRLARTHR